MKLERLLIFLMVLSIFLDDFIIGYTNNDARQASAFDFYYYYLIFLSFLTYFMFKEKKMPFLPRWFLLPLLLLFLASFVAGIQSDKLRFSMLKQMIGITFSSVAYYNLIRFVKFDIKRLFDLYLKIAFWIALYGVAEEIMRLSGYNYLFANAKRVSVGLYRVYSIMGEPYFLCVALIPAVYFYLNKILGTADFRDRKALMRLGVILACYVFTFSSAGFIGLGIMAVLIAYNHRFLTPTSGRFFILVILVFIFGPGLNMEDLSLKEMEVRLTDSYKAFGTTGTLDKKQIAELNSSTFALYSNYLIAQKSFSANPILGSGLGTHEVTYNDYFETLFGTKFMIMYGHFNQKDGNSLFIRMMSETGLLGLIIIFIFIIKFFAGRKYILDKETAYLTIINQGIFVVFIIRILRTGNYISQGFFFFFFLYYFTYILLRNEELRLSESTG